MTRAAILRGNHEKLSIEEIDVDEPRAGEVLVRLSASGVCHSDLAVIEGLMPMPFPAVLGHEGAGVVEAVGEGVTRVAPGDHVIMSATPECGVCYQCRRGQASACAIRLVERAPGGQLDGTTRLHQGGHDIYQFCFEGTFSERTVTPEISVVKIPPASNMVVAALIGCGVTTGVGAARNTADIQAGDTVAVLGCGGVGLNVVQGAKLAGAGRIIAIDMLDSKLELARRMGATDVVNAREHDPVAAVQSLTEGRGADVSFEVTGNPIAVNQLNEFTRRGGEMVFIGIATPEAVIPVRPLMSSGKTAKGCLYGSANVVDDFPRLLREYEEGLLEIDLLVSKEIGLEDINGAFDDMIEGRVAALGHRLRVARDVRTAGRCARPRPHAFHGPGVRHLEARRSRRRRREGGVG